MAPLEHNTFLPKAVRLDLAEAGSERRSDPRGFAPVSVDPFVAGCFVLDNYFLLNHLFAAGTVRFESVESIHLHSAHAAIRGVHTLGAR